MDVRIEIKDYEDPELLAAKDQAADHARKMVEQLVAATAPETDPDYAPMPSLLVNALFTTMQGYSEVAGPMTLEHLNLALNAFIQNVARFANEAEGRC
ncbi:MAG: hypothetical protein QNI84_13250 [Henriciella sp.]|nr:hypothetical protein [Henriciella sp.]